MKTSRFLSVCLGFLIVFGLAVSAFSKDNIGTVVAVRNKAVIKRDGKTADAKVKEGILLNDTVTTMEDSKIKMLFVDESVLTLGEKSAVVIKDFVHSKDKRGKSIFNLIDGRLRSVVGKTNFEVHSPTAVAAARGTVILHWTGVIPVTPAVPGLPSTPVGKKFTIIICLEGKVIASSSDSNIPGAVTLTPKMMTIAVEGERLSHAVLAPESLIDRLLMETDISNNEIRILGPLELEGLPALTPLTNQQPIILSPGTTTPVPPTPPPPPPPPHSDVPVPSLPVFPPPHDPFNGSG